MVKKHPIYCKCGEFIGYQEDFMFMVIAAPVIKCSRCGSIVISSGCVYKH